ncbi:glycosyltransferase family 1 protein [Jeotgalibacillus salarius]|uniref:Glycosyltransferase family 1 protein n=1 Tax=Jeotgalibacillus salarius TaxID=546023 RepID=A0A4Y8LNG6_9BACL|nr:glycosyltransferase family 1 protein [Jeotgalibacillus salarius]TFE04133.1 glycosyltransferase family 1 protein [Jeotgalibacillus salarius]
MKNILIKHSHKAYLPQIEAAVSYFENRDVPFQLINYDQSPEADEREADAIWSFPGIEYRNQLKIPRIHEYASLSTGYFPKVKNRLKKVVNTRPDLRIFLNELVEQAYQFSDHVPSIQRDMGVHTSFFNQQLTKKSYDFVYCGSISKSRGIHKVLNHFKTHQKKHSLLLIGAVEDDLYNRFKDESNITFTGKIPYSDVPSVAAQAIYGLNYMPDQYPFNIQTSTKLLEYIALDLHVITTRYQWAQQFQKKYHLPFTFVNENLSDLVIKEPPLISANYDHSLKQCLTWDYVFLHSGLEEALSSLV